MKDAESLTHVAAEDLATFTGVEYDGSNPPKVQTPASAGNEPDGIVQDGADQDENVSLVIDGRTRLTANSSIDEGEWVALGTSGQGQTATSGDFPVGRALEDASSGDDFEIQVKLQVNDVD